MLIFLAISLSFKESFKTPDVVIQEINPNDEVAYFASGCFWCVEAIFESVEGVSEAISGYAGGHTKNPTYQTIGTGRTGHAEAVAVYYDPQRVSFKILVDVFFGSHDPTTKNGQHPDYGSQ
ncbi:peptide-methionine (S)-S-oxide reductase MsrA, partial [Flavobacteriaceae bacterium]|nr:peptide-methionine (S)-S-oxide reductase MsrA [Flavobacteriaceae bacterium]